MQVYEKFSEAETTNSARIGSLVTWKRQKNGDFLSIAVDSRLFAGAWAIK